MRWGNPLGGLLLLGIALSSRTRVRCAADVGPTLTAVVRYVGSHLDPRWIEIATFCALRDVVIRADETRQIGSQNAEQAILWPVRVSRVRLGCESPEGTTAAIEC